MDKLKKLLPLPLFILIAVLTICFRYVPKGKNWDGYKVIYVQKDVPAQTVEQIFSSSGIAEYVGLNSQRIPIMLTKNSPEETMLRLSVNDPQNSYLYERQNYFYDSQGQYLVYYIPEQYQNFISAALSMFKDKGYSAGADTSLPYLWVLPCVIILIAVILFGFSKNKTFFALSAIIPCIYICCNAFYSCAIAVIILLLCLFVISNLYKRKGAVQKLIKNPLLIIAFVISIIAAFASALLPGIFYLLCVGACVCAYYMAGSLKSFTLRKNDFVPVLIRPASKISPYAGKSNIVMPVLLAASVIVFAYFSFGSLHLTGVKSDSKVLVPGATTMSQADSKLPDFEKFYRWNWNVLTNPYKSLNNNSEYDENHVVYPRYFVKEGIIEQSNQVLTYDDSFRKQVYDDIDNLDFYSIESVIKSQGNDFFAGYTQSGSYNISIFSIIMMITGFFMLLFIYFSAMIGKGGRK